MGGAFCRLGQCPWRAGYAETVRVMRGRGRLGQSAESYRRTRKGKDPTGGARLAVREGGGAPDWAKTRELGRWRGFGPCGKERKEGRGEENLGR